MEQREDTDGGGRVKREGSAKLEYPGKEKVYLICPRKFFTCLIWIHTCSILKLANLNFAPKFSHPSHPYRELANAREMERP